MVNYQRHALDLIFTALSDPTRRAILDRLAEGEATVGQIAKPFIMTLPAISKHLKMLERAHLVTRKRDGRLHRLSLNSTPMVEADAWIARYRRFWSDQPDAQERPPDVPESGERPDVPAGLPGPGPGNDSEPGR
jgi:DNA-binding transcriptional ArsR family regulator